MWSALNFLLERGANPRAKDLTGTSCLEIAKRRGHEDVVRLLENRGWTDSVVLNFIKRLFFFF